MTSVISKNFTAEAAAEAVAEIAAEIAALRNEYSQLIRTIFGPAPESSINKKIMNLLKRFKDHQLDSVEMEGLINQGIDRVCYLRERMLELIKPDQNSGSGKVNEIAINACLPKKPKTGTETGNEPELNSNTCEFFVTISGVRDLPQDLMLEVNKKFLLGNGFISEAEFMSMSKKEIVSKMQDYWKLYPYCEFDQNLRLYIDLIYTTGGIKKIIGEYSLTSNPVLDQPVNLADHPVLAELIERIGVNSIERLYSTIVEESDSVYSKLMNMFQRVIGESGCDEEERAKLGAMVQKLMNDSGCASPGFYTNSEALFKTLINNPESYFTDLINLFQNLVDSSGGTFKNLDSLIKKLIDDSQGLHTKTLQDYQAKRLGKDRHTSISFEEIHEALNCLFAYYRLVSETILMHQSLNDLMQRSEFVLGLTRTAEAKTIDCVVRHMQLDGVRYATLTEVNLNVANALKQPLPYCDVYVSRSGNDMFVIKKNNFRIVQSSVDRFAATDNEEYMVLEFYNEYDILVFIKVIVHYTSKTEEDVKKTPNTPEKCTIGQHNYVLNYLNSHYPSVPFSISGDFNFSPTDYHTRDSRGIVLKQLFGLITVVNPDSDANKLRVETIQAKKGGNLVSATCLATVYGNLGTELNWGIADGSLFGYMETMDGDLADMDSPTICSANPTDHRVLRSVFDILALTKAGLSHDVYQCLTQF